MGVGGVSQATRVLVVDDDAENLAGMCELLAFWGYEVEAVADGKAALAAAGRQCPDVAVMDLGLRTVIRCTSSSS